MYVYRSFLTRQLSLYDEGSCLLASVKLGEREGEGGGGGERKRERDREREEEEEEEESCLD